MSESSWRTNRLAVSKILETDRTIVLNDLTGLDPYIDVANDLVTNVCGTLGYTANTAELIERWLSAHFYHVRDPEVSSEGAGGVSQSKWGSVGLNLDQTRYGQQAKLIDFKGGLAALDKRTKDGRGAPGVTWLGSRGPCGPWN